jgi:cytochrome c-type biogenesis protein
MISDLVSHGLSSWWAPALAFAAGVISFVSPCVFPLVPGYIAFVTGGDDRRRPVLPILLFILGFASVFTALGVLLPRFSGWFSRHHDLLLDVGGSIVVAFGVLMVVYALRLRIPFLYSERRPLLSKVRPGPMGAMPLGMAFAIGWTPCIGPVLGGILTLAAGQGSGARGGLLLFVYSAGLGVPFLIVGLGVRRLVGALDALKRNYHWIAGIAGVLMIAIGVLLLTHQWERVLAPFLRLGNRINLPI